MSDEVGSSLGGPERPIVNIVGERVALGPLHRDLLLLVERWNADFRTVDLGGDDPRPWTTESSSALLDSMLRGERDDWIGFAVYALPELRPIGWANIRDFTNAHGTAEFGIAIGDPADRGHGYGTEAVQLLVDYAFTVLGVHNIWLDTPAYNAAALRAYQKVGFREIGRRRGARVLAGKRYDVVLMDCVPDEFIPPARRALPDSD